MRSGGMLIPGQNLTGTIRVRAFEGRINRLLNNTESASIQKRFHHARRHPGAPGKIGRLKRMLSARQDTLTLWCKPLGKLTGRQETSRQKRGIKRLR
jgi:hypothetical protein